MFKNDTIDHAPTPFDHEATERDALLEFVAMAEETAMSELAAFGFIDYESGINDAEFDGAEFWLFAADLYESVHPDSEGDDIADYDPYEYAEDEAYVLSELY